MYMGCFEVHNSLSYFCTWSFLLAIFLHAYATSIFLLGKVFLVVFSSYLFIYKVYETFPTSLTKFYFNYMLIQGEEEDLIFNSPFDYIKNLIIHQVALIVTKYMHVSKGGYMPHSNIIECCNVNL